MDQPASFSSLALMAGMSAASFLALLYLFQRHIGGMPLVEYEPRRRVPWGTVVALVALLFPLAGIAKSLTSAERLSADETIVEGLTEEIVPEDQTEEPERPSRFVINGLFASIVMLTFVAVITIVLRDYYSADGHDIGLPATREQLKDDIWLGTVACLAALLPIYMIQIALTLLLQPESGHPMVEELQRSHTPAMMVVGVLMVVVAAPVFEEFSFRLLLQGWLEKWEDQHTGFFATERNEHAMSDPTDADDAAASHPQPILLPMDRGLAARPPSGVLPDLPHGWLPILISGTVFGLAHWGHGVSPVPLVLFGMVLGYLYQRTHRLVPSITAHALFNANSMMMLWLTF